MSDKVKAYLEKKRLEKKKEKEKILIELGLYEKEYTDESTSVVYPHYDNQVGKAYRLVVPELSDSEYAEIRAYETSVAESPEENNDWKVKTWLAKAPPCGRQNYFKEGLCLFIIITCL